MRYRVYLVENGDVCRVETPCSMESLLDVIEALGRSSVKCNGIADSQVHFEEDV